MLIIIRRVKFLKHLFKGLGGSFVMKTGKAKQHVMPDFSETPLNTEAQLDKWLHFYEMSAPLIAVGTFVSAETVSFILITQNNR